MTYRFITAALPYGNGPLHFGHLAGVYIPADIYHRHSLLSGVDSVYICGSDEHGVAIMLSAEKQGIPFQDWVNQWNVEHQKLFKAYDLEFTYFGRTTSERHKFFAQEFFKKIHATGYLKEKTESQAYCLPCQMFLPDRYLNGTCGYCGYREARGDECPECGRWLSLEMIKNLSCAKCGQNQIEIKQGNQWYFNLPKLAPQIRQWLESQTQWKENVKNYALSLLKEIPERAVTRNLKWGIDLPTPFHEEGKKIYVWFEAPIGYYTNLREFFEKKNDENSWKKYWNLPSEMIHFIGKDNIIFHTIIWPAMLMAAGERLPTNVPANMFVQLQKKQFSKSLDWTVDAEEALKTFGVDRLRYYLISIIPEVQDTNFDWQIFHDKVNSELVNKIANLFNRVGTQIKKHYEGTLSPQDFTEIKNLKTVHEEVGAALERFEIIRALSKIVRLAEEANKYLDDVKPWNVVRENKEGARKLFATASNFMVSIAALLQPFLPSYSHRVLEAFLIPEDFKLRSILYQSGGYEMLRGRGLKIIPQSDLTIPRLEETKIKEEIKKLEQLS